MGKKVSEIINRGRVTDDKDPRVIRMEIYNGVLYKQCKAVVLFEFNTTKEHTITFEIEYPIADGKHLPSRMSYVGTKGAPSFYLNRAMAKTIRRVLKEMGL